LSLRSSSALKTNEELTETKRLYLQQSRGTMQPHTNVSRLYMRSVVVVVVVVVVVIVVVVVLVLIVVVVVMAAQYEFIRTSRRAAVNSGVPPPLWETQSISIAFHSAPRAV